MARQSEILVAKVQKQGFTVVETKKGWMALSKDGKSAATWHKSPSDHRAYKNICSRLRHIGVDTTLL